MNIKSESIHDELLVLHCQEGDSKAFEDLVTRWQPRLWRYARQLTGDKDAAWDVVQNACMAIIRDIEKLEDQARLRQWAYSIASHKIETLLLLHEIYCCGFLP
ncbi:MAG: RNA polymerase sigma factor [Calditrichaeota bacterium]|nr:RNA polymerase sigma factor [Calditrichota bacterium]